jgi:hypothetical protein
MNATTAIILDKRIKSKDDTYAVKLRITYNRTQQYYPLNIHLSTEDWEKAQITNSTLTYYTIVVQNPKDSQVYRSNL